MTHEGQILVALLLIGAGSYPAMFEKTGVPRASLYTLCNRLRQEKLIEQFYDSSDEGAVTHRLTLAGQWQARCLVEKHPDHPMSKEAATCGKYRPAATAEQKQAPAPAATELSKKARRAVLNDHAKAIKDIELTDTAIGILERVSGSGRIVAMLKKSQHKHLERIDAAAAKLGAPYPA